MQQGDAEVEGSEGTLCFERKSVGSLVGVPKGLEQLVPRGLQNSELRGRNGCGKNSVD